MFRESMLRAISCLVITTFTCGLLQPAVAAVRVDAAASARTAAAPASSDEDYSAALQDLRERVKHYRDKPAPEGMKALRDDIRRLESLEPGVDVAFDATGKALDDKHVAQEIKDRHKAAVADYRAKRDAMKRILRGLEDADDANDDAVRGDDARALDDFLDANPAGRIHQKLDPDKLPWRALDGKVRAPAETAADFSKSLAKSLAPGAPALAKAAVAGPGPADLAATDDAQITQPIRDLAASLNNDPVAIYNWVRNNIAYTPTFGSVQGSDVTLSKKKGNAFDTASLLIALYRAAGIPARYVYGTIMVPAAAAMNWVGGVASPQAAQQIWGQGGVPNAGVVTGGQVTAIKLEHVWVEAWVDFVPSRGRKPRQADAWVPLDASFKQFTYTDGLAKDVNLVPDPAALRAAMLSGAVVNDADGSVQGLNMAAMDSAGGGALRQLNDFVRARKPDATNADVFGGRSIVTLDRAAFAGALPYRTIAVGARYSDLPASLTQKFRYRIYASDLDRALDNPMIAFDDVLPNLAGKKITILYAPATQADVDLIMAYAPGANPDGSPPGPDQLKNFSLPAYLVHLRPELRVDGVVRATGSTVTMGTQLFASGAFTTYDLSGWDETSDQLVAGQVTALGLDIEGIDHRQMDQLKARMDASRAKIQANDFTGLTGDVVTGDIVTTTLWSYFAAVDQGGRAGNSRARMVDLPALSYGLSHIDIDVVYSFGFPRTARPSGIALDVGHLRAVRWSKDNDRNAWVTYNRIQGQYESAMEHNIPEVLFVRPETPAEGVSAVKLLGKAAQAGQKIFTITGANLAQALPQLTLSSDTVSDIRNAVLAGKEVTVHQAPVVVNGWQGAGYTVLDPATGAGAYLLAGGTNGGKLLASIAGLLVGFVAGIYLGALIWAVTIGAAATLGAFIVAALLVALIFFAINMIIAMTSDEETYLCYSGGALAGLAIGLSLMTPLGTAIAAIMTLAAWLFVPANAVVQCLG